MKKRKMITYWIVLALVCSMLSGTKVVAASDGKTKTYAGEGYKIIYCVEDAWTGGYRAAVIIENTGAETIENWGVSFYQNANMIQYWNGTLHQSGETFYSFKNAGWNQDIEPGSSICFGYIAEGDSRELPADMVLTGTQTVVSESDYEIFYDVVSKWEGGYVAELQIKNISAAPIEDWKLSFAFDDEISDIWNAKISEQKNNTYLLGNIQANYKIEPDRTVSFGFIVTKGSADTTPDQYQLYSIQQGNEKEDSKEESGEEKEPAGEIEMSVVLDDFQYNRDLEMYYVEEPLEELCGTISPMDQVEALEYQVTSKDGAVISRDSIEKKAEWRMDGPSLAYGTNCLTITARDKNKKEYHYALQFYNSNCESANDMLTDQELVKHLVEEDSDQDGLYDYLEAEIMGQNPFCRDSDGNGVPDGAEDYDGDGLSNQEEIALGTDPLQADTDEDGIEDQEEIDVSQTDPLSADTDGDGASDQWEIDHHYDPLRREEAFQSSRELEPGGNIRRVQIRVTSEDGAAAENLSLKAVEEDIFLNDALPGALGAAVELETTGDFQRARLTCELGDVLAEDSAVEPAWYYFNEETQLLEKVADQKLSGNVLEASLEHFSKYVLLDSVLYEGILKNRYEKQEADEGNELPTDYVFVLDTS